MDHDVDRRTISTEYWDQTVKLITPILQSLRENNINATFEEVCRSVGICEVNSYEIYNVDRKTGYKAVLPLTSLLSHSCQPNCRPIIERKFPYDNRWFATVDIPKGVELTIHYTHLTDPTSIRIKVLKENWYFECTCSRCLDPKDLDSYLEAIKCTQCWEKNQEKEGKGYFRPKGHFREETNAWVCDSCGEVRTNEMNEMLVKQLQDEKDAIGLMNLSDLVTFSKKAEGLLHVNHYILTSVRRWVIPLFCRALRGYNEADVRKSFPPEMYKDKIDMCQKQLKVLDICDPGLSKSRGKVLYELADSVIRYHNSNYQAEQLEISLFTNELKTCASWLEESVKCLQIEREKTFEKTICRAAESLLNETNEFMAYLLGNVG